MNSLNHMRYEIHDEKVSQKQQKLYLNTIEVEAKKKN